MLKKMVDDTLIKVNFCDILVLLRLANMCLYNRKLFCNCPQDGSYAVVLLYSLVFQMIR